MNLDQLRIRHQTSLSQADAAACRASRHTHRTLAAGYARRIAVLAPAGDAS
ncbi:MAG: hypothetical protein PGN09_13480 [Sphingomonas fennica]